MEVIIRPTTHSYHAALQWNSEKKTGTITSDERTPIPFAPPVEFGGTNAVWSPEQLLASSVASCYLTTFLHFASLLKVKVRNIKVDVSMEIEKKDKAGYVVTNYVLRPYVEFEVTPGPHTLAEMFSKAERYCIISNSVAGKISVKPEIINTSN